MADNWQLKAVLSAVDNLSPVLKGIQGVARTTRKYLGDIGKSAGKLSSQIGMPFALISGIVGGFSIAAIKNAIVGFTDLGESVYKGSMRAGMGVEEYQRTKYIAEQAGVGIEMLEGSLAKLNAQTAKAAAGKNKDLSALYQRLGISVRDGNGDIRSAVDLLPELADAFQRNKNPAVQARMGVALFGRAWAEMAPLLMEGSEGINQSLERFKRLKGVMSFDDIKGAKELGDKFKDLNFVTKGFQNTIAKELVPVLGPLVEDIVQWAAANRKVVAAGVKEFISGLVTSLRSVNWERVIQGAKDFTNSLGYLVDMIGGPKNALIALVIFMNLQTIAAFVSLGGAVVRLIGFLGGPLLGALRAVWVVMMANPIALLVAAVVGLAVIIYRNWDNIVAYVSAAWDRIKAVFNVGFFDGMIQLWLESWQGLANGIIGIVKTILPEKLMPEAMRNFKFTFATDRAAAIVSPISPDAARAAVAGVPLAANRFSLGQSGAEDFRRPSLLPQQQAKVGGEIKVSFKNAPPGMRVEQAAAGPVAINTDVGYRFDAFSGAAY